MTKVCTAYTCCRVMEEMGLLNTHFLKNIYLRVTKRAAVCSGTSAYLNTDN